MGKKGYSGSVLAAIKGERKKKWVPEAIEEIRKHLPFELLGIDSDNEASSSTPTWNRYLKAHLIFS